MAEAEARYTFLHEGVLQGYLSRIGTQAGDASIYWKYGCWFYEETTDSRVLIEGLWEDTEREADAGSIRLRAWGENAETLLDPLLEALKSLPVGQPPEVNRTIALRGTARASAVRELDLRQPGPGHLEPACGRSRSDQGHLHQRYLHDGDRRARPLQ
jgi:hypothetical protein